MTQKKQDPAIVCYAEQQAERWLKEYTHESRELRKASLMQLIRIVQRQSIEAAVHRARQLALEYYPDISDDDGV